MCSFLVHTRFFLPFPAQNFLTKADFYEKTLDKTFKGR